MPDYVVLILVAALGLALGSFFNVCIYRLPREQSLVTPASRCTSCGRPLRWYENIPLVSYVALGGRCRTCKTHISVVYPVIELAAAAIAVVWYLHFGSDPLLFLSRTVFAFALIVLFVIDLQHRILPNVITLPGIIVGFLFSLVAPPDTVARVFTLVPLPDRPDWLSSLIGIGVGGGLLWLISEVYLHIRGEEGLGMGDVKMIAMIGAFLGWQRMLLALVLASLLGSIVGVAIIAVRKGDMKYALPFGSFLTLGALVASLAGKQMVEWYGSFFNPQ